MLEGLSKPLPKEGYCKVADIASSLDPDDRKILLQAVADSSWAAKALSRQLRERGVQVSDTTILRHRRKECPCE
jgi:hypothetical protein